MVTNRKARKAQRKTIVSGREEVFLYRGKTIEELQALTLEQFAALIPSRQRRKVARGLTDREKQLMDKVANTDGPVRTHLRTALVLPSFVGREFQVYNGKEFVRVTIQPEMVGHLLGEFAQTRRLGLHTGPGVGATRSSKYLPLK